MKSQTAEIRETLIRLTFENQENKFPPPHLQRRHAAVRIHEARRHGSRPVQQEAVRSRDDWHAVRRPRAQLPIPVRLLATLASCFCIEGGMDSETSFNMSDVYIRKCDKCTEGQDIFDLRVEMFRDYTTKMQEINRSRIYSLPVSKVISFVEGHLHEPISLAQLAKEIGLSPAYLSTVSKKEMRVSVSKYIRSKCLDAAELLLVYSDFPCADIAEYLAFSPNSHFTHLFKERTGETPLTYRNAHHASHWPE